MPPSQFRRKNGQQSSCENCRKSKLACDHAIPHCGRCVRLKRKDTCVYLLSPLARSSTPGAPQSSAVAKRSTKVRPRPFAQGVSTTHEYALPDFPLGEVATVTQDRPRDVRFDSLASSSLEIPSQMTSWGSIFSEFNIEVEPGISDPHPVRDLGLTWKDPEILQHATTALTKIPTRAMCEGLLEHAINYPDFGCHEPYLRLLHDGWWDSFDVYLDKDPSSLNSLEPLIEQVWANTANRITEHLQSGSTEWLQMWTGQNTTWDALAYLMSTYGSACASLLPYHPLLADCDKSQLCRDMRMGIKACLSICEAQEIFSVNLVNARASMVLLQNSCDGDDCTSLWRRNHLFLFLTPFVPEKH